MKLTVWANHELRPGARELFYDSVARLGCRLIQSTKSSRSVLTEGSPDPALAEADIAYGQPDPADIAANERLRWVALSTAGYTRYDRDDFRAAMRARGTVVTNASRVFAGPCAEHLLAMMLAHTRELPKYVLNQAGPREWGYAVGRYTIQTLTGKTVLLLGYGAIAVRLAELLAAFHCRVIGVRRNPRGDEKVEIVKESEIMGVLALADHVVNVLPAAPATEHFCSTWFFAAMRRGAYFYNIGRGATVDQDALLEALRSGQLSGAYLDALDPEPLPKEHPLWLERNCHITPHLGGGHREQDESLVKHFVDNLQRFQRGEPLIDRII
ncbi:MAG TPA: D-2-hydroxyacid dehydrogenase [Candidatus Didemnitutus sp.]|nr:D-2-hydroxyacid dehydrogenase [Candidatus Didemnitutus sp.]